MFHLILTRLSWLQLRKEGLHLLLSDNGDYDFDIKVGRCEFMGFVNDVIDCGCLWYVFCFRIKEKENDTFYINFYSITFIQSFFFFSSLLQLNNYNIYVCNLQLLFFMMNLLLIKFYNNYAIIHIQHSLKLYYIKHYNIIGVSHG